MNTKLNLLAPALMAWSLTATLHAETMTPETLAAPGASVAYSAPTYAPAIRGWKISLAPLAASQVLDMTSSWGMRELNPALASADGSFGMKAVSTKIGVTAAMVGVEYLLVKKYPKSARILSKINWSGAVLTSSFAAHNYMIR